VGIIKNATASCKEKHDKGIFPAYPTRSMYGDIEAKPGRSLRSDLKFSTHSLPPVAHIQTMKYRRGTAIKPTIAPFHNATCMPASSGAIQVPMSSVPYTTNIVGPDKHLEIHPRDKIPSGGSRIIQAQPGHLPLSDSEDEDDEEEEEEEDQPTPPWEAV
jgi:hypothetical protein